MRQLARRLVFDADLVREVEQETWLAARIHAGAPRAFESLVAVSGPDGAYALGALPSGRRELAAEGASGGGASATLALAPGQLVPGDYRVVLAGPVPIEPIRRARPRAPARLDPERPRPRGFFTLPCKRE